MKLESGVIKIQFTILAIDPGKFKCGLAVMTHEGTPLLKLILQPQDIETMVTQFIKEYKITVIVVGDRTNSQKICTDIKKITKLPIIKVDEDKSSLEGRYRYLNENSHGISKLLPIGLRIPSQPYDDYVAVIIAERFLKIYPNYFSLMNYSKTLLDE